MSLTPKEKQNLIRKAKANGFDPSKKPYTDLFFEHEKSSMQNEIVEMDKKLSEMEDGSPERQALEGQIRLKVSQYTEVYTPTV